LEAAEPFIVKFQQNSIGQPLSEPLHTVMPGAPRFGVVSPTLVSVMHGGGRLHDVEQPLPVVTTAQGGEFALTAATMVQMGYGEREGQTPRALDIEQPLGTVVAGGIKHGVVSAFMAQANGGFNDERGTPAHELRRPMTSVTSRGSQQQLVSAHLAQLRGHCDARSLEEPLRTVSAGGEHHALVEYTLSPEAEEGALRCAAFLMRYHGSGGQWGSFDDPMTTITTRDRLALVTVWLQGEPWVIVDIALRMLTPRELYNANSFPATYVIDRGHDGRVFSKSAQVRMCGNAVPPLLGRAVIAAQCESRPSLREAA
jgi:DNA (cytosine-5)-methyltransferase 1